MLRTGTNRAIELDIYLEDKQLAFEYQGEQHFYDIYSCSGGRWNQKQRDEEKRIKCKEYGITLIEIPYWWSKKENTLVATIAQSRPDIFLSSDEQPIPLEPTNGFPSRTGVSCLS